MALLNCPSIKLWIPVVRNQFFLKRVTDVTVTYGSSGGGLLRGGFPQLSSAYGLVRTTAVAEFSKQEVVLQVISQLNITPRYNRYMKG